MSKQLYKDFINPEAPKSLPDSHQEYDVISIPNFVNPDIFHVIKANLAGTKKSWWKKAIKPGRVGEDPSVLDFGASDQRELEERVRRYRNEGYFTYSFSKIDSENGAHVIECWCTFCRVCNTVKSQEVMDYLSALLGKKVTRFTETFGSKYDKGDYLGIHHDNSKGNYAFIIGLTDNWLPTYGGILHMMDREQKEITKSIIPSFGSLTIFKVREDNTSHHFVSEVVVDKPRYAYTGWFNVE